MELPAVQMMDNVALEIAALTVHVQMVQMVIHALTTVIAKADFALKDIAHLCIVLLIAIVQLELVKMDFAFVILQDAHAMKTLIVQVIFAS